MRKHPGKALTNMVLSCVLCSIAVNWVALPNGFVVTGITGLSMAAAQFTGVNYALIYYGLALAILLCTALALGWREVSNILVLSLLYPVVLCGLNHIQVEIILQEKLIAVMLFGAIYGLGSGLTYRLGYSLDAVAYAFVGQLLYVSCMNHVIFNLGPKLYEVEIICDQPQKIERFIIQDIHKSATIDQVTGSYSGQPKTQLDCVCTSREYVRLREFIRDGGYDCFIKVYPLTHVFGHNKDFHHLDDDNLE